MVIDWAGLRIGEAGWQMVATGATGYVECTTREGDWHGVMFGTHDGCLRLSFCWAVSVSQVSLTNVTAQKGGGGINLIMTFTSLKRDRIRYPRNHTRSTSHYFLAYIFPHLVPFFGGCPMPFPSKLSQKSTLFVFAPFRFRLACFLLMTVSFSR